VTLSALNHGNKIANKKREQSKQPAIILIIIKEMVEK